MNDETEHQGQGDAETRPDAKAAAIQAVKRAVEQIERTWPRAEVVDAGHELLARVLLQCGQFSHAETVARELIISIRKREGTLSPRLIDATRLLAAAFDGQGRKEDALAALDIGMEVVTELEKADAAFLAKAERIRRALWGDEC